MGVLSNGIITNWVFCASRHQANQSFGKKKQPLRKNGSVFKKSESESEPRGGYKYTGHWTTFHFLAKSQTLKLSEAEDFIVKKGLNMVSKVADDEMLISETFSKDAFWHAHKYTTNIFGEKKY